MVDVDVQQALFCQLQRGARHFMNLENERLPASLPDTYCTNDARCVPFSASNSFNCPDPELKSEGFDGQPSHTKSCRHVPLTPT